MYQQWTYWTIDKKIRAVMEQLQPGSESPSPSHTCTRGFYRGHISLSQKNCASADTRALQHHLFAGHMFSFSKPNIPPPLINQQDMPRNMAYANHWSYTHAPKSESCTWCPVNILPLVPTSSWITHMPMPVALMYMRLPPSYMSYPPSLMYVPLVPSANPYKFGKELMMLEAELTNKVTVAGNGSACSHQFHQS